MYVALLQTNFLIFFFFWCLSQFSLSVLCSRIMLNPISAIHVQFFQDMAGLIFISLVLCFFPSTSRVDNLLLYPTTPPPFLEDLRKPFLCFFLSPQVQINSFYTLHLEVMVLSSHKVHHIDFVIAHHSFILVISQNILITHAENSSSSVLSCNISKQNSNDPLYK